MKPRFLQTKTIHIKPAINTKFRNTIKCEQHFLPDKNENKKHISLPLQ